MKKEKRLKIFMVPGIFNNYKFFKPFYTFNKNLHIGDYPECIFQPIDLPLRDTCFNRQPDPDVGTRSSDDDSAYLREQIAANTRAGDFVVGMGHSRGALLLLMVAQKIKFDALVLSGPAMPKGISSVNLGSLITFMELLWTPFFWRRPVKRSFLATKWGVLDSSMPYSRARDAYESLVWESGRTLYELGFNQPEIDADKIIENCPRRLIVGGDKDRLIRSGAVHKLSKLLRAEEKFFSTAHYPFWGVDSGKLIKYIYSWLLK